MKKIIRKFAKIVRRNRKAILEYIQMAYFLAFILLMFVSKTGAIISAFTLIAMIVSVNAKPSKKR